MNKNIHEFKDFIGIDVSKAKLDFAIFSTQNVRTYENNLESFKLLWKEQKNVLLGSFVVLECTGGHEKKVLTFLQKKGITVHRADSRKVKHFIRSYGTQAKNDRIDALALASYGFERHPKLLIYKEISKDLIQLKALAERRKDLVNMLVKEKNRAKAPNISKYILNSIIAIIKQLQKEIDKVNADIAKLIEQNKDISAKRDVLKTVTGVGNVVAMELLAGVPELGTVSRKKIASLMGLAPFTQDSGTKKGYRSVSGGRRYIKPCLFMAALSASKSNSELGNFYRKLIANGKRPLVALTALMRKIIVILNAKVRDYYENMTIASA